MDKFALDYSSLQTGLNKKKAYKIEDVKDKIKKVAFDVCRFQDPDTLVEGLWKMEGDYIVALYDEETPIKTASDWSVVSDKSQQNINFFYKNVPIVRLASSRLNIPADEISSTLSYLPEKLASNSALVQGLLLEMPSEERHQLLTQYPELNK
jgi:hypothetical protein